MKTSKGIVKMKREKVDIGYLQETHLCNAEKQKHEKLEIGFRHTFIPHRVSKNEEWPSRSKQNKFEHISNISDKEGRFILIKAK